jgi:hypothetical protein
VARLQVVEELIASTGPAAGEDVGSMDDPSRAVGRARSFLDPAARDTGYNAVSNFSVTNDS